jgi:hypothetical protein
VMRGGWEKNKGKTTNDVLQPLYPIVPVAIRHGYNNERPKTGVKREKPAVGGGK